MIIKRINQDNEIKVIYKSSTILASTYDKNTKGLTVTFNNGSQYSYEGVRDVDYTLFEIADSQGKALNSNIKQYPFKKLDNIDTNVILEEIRRIEEQALHSMGQLLIKEMALLVNHHDTFDVINSAQYGRVKSVMEKYNEILNGQVND